MKELVGYRPDDSARYATNQCVFRNIAGYHGTGSNDDMTADGDTGQDDGIGTNPHIIAYDNRFGGDALLVNPFRCIFKIVVQCCHRNALCQIHMTAYRDRPDNRIVNANAGVVANDNIAHGIVDAAERLYYTMSPQRKLPKGWGVHSH